MNDSAFYLTNFICQTTSKMSYPAVINVLWGSQQYACPLQHCMASIRNSGVAAFQGKFCMCSKHLASNPCQTKYGWCIQVAVLQRAGIARVYSVHDKQRVKINKTHCLKRLLYFISFFNIIIEPQIKRYLYNGQTATLSQSLYTL